ncbi:hypothetical protein ATO6_01055 [Oceanicola sp. 22II-s10i]|uniref:TFIIB-type zinc ribbon-containing protein n=1 Tax=Oceanicola sp. 22II-s10i TaxID=1317116 RepID=UPI000B523966|nr:zf-TFIIB domain-containing protein [Oceanicola sp. 22II-s10i]OWU85562.1 hypothetical protein ATO6_01055 [Oceanicola sp. 22II-s10i]
MKCPVDGTQLMMTERQGVEIDYCPSCRGVWLDRGELDKIIDRSAQELGEAVVTPPPPPQPAPAPQPHHMEPPRDRGHDRRYDGDRRYDDDRRYHGYDPRYRDDDRKYYKKRKRKSLLSEIFDFD